MNDSLLKRFEQNGGFLRSADSLSPSEKYHIRKLIKKGIVSRVKRGLYRVRDFSGIFQEAEVSNMVPQGIFCMFTAWSFYELTTHISAEFHMAIPKSLKIVLPEYPPVKLYYWSTKTIELGMTTAEINGSKVRIYDPERSVCDAVKFRNKIGMDIVSEILRNYVHRNDKNLDRLMKYAIKLRIKKTITQLLQIIL